MAKSRKTGPIDTIYGRFMQEAKRRLDLTYDYESAEIAGFRKITDLIQPTLLLDIGANIGVYTIFVSPVPSLRRIMAFEPAPEAFALLERNVALQEDTRISCHNEALSNHDGSAEFALFGAMAGNNAILESVRTKSGSPSETIEVAVARLDDRIQTEGEIFMAKIDVEGHELQVVGGARDFLTRNTGVLQIEAFRTLGKLDSRLETLGYVRLFQMKDDYYYTNISDMEQREAIRGILFAETATALKDLMVERRRRRQALRMSRDAIKTLVFSQDPVLKMT